MIRNSPLLAIRSVLYASALLVGSVATASAESSTVTLHFDPARTTIHITAGGALHRVHGSFLLKGGELAFDPSTGVAQGQILVDAASGHTDDKKLDTRMQDEVLESQKYPEIFFHVEKSSGTLKCEKSPQPLTLIGSFNIHGADHPLKVEALITLNGDDATAKAEFDVPYVEWGMKDVSSLLLRARTVHVAIDAHATAEGLAGAKR